VRKSNPFSGEQFIFRPAKIGPPGSGYSPSGWKNAEQVGGASPEIASLKQKDIGLAAKVKGRRQKVRDKMNYFAESGGFWLHYDRNTRQTTHLRASDNRN
jgi:hypothetical protein